MKLLYLVTANVPPELRSDWLEWMTARHIPDVMATGMFLCCRLLRDASDEGRFVVLYEAGSPEEYTRYKTEFAPALQAAHRNRYGEAITTSRMEMLESAGFL